MKRVDGWEGRLASFIESRRNIGMEWSTSDCLTLSLGAIKAITNKHIEECHPEVKFTGKYKTSKGAYRLMKKYSGGGVADACSFIAGKMGMREVAPAYAGRGDLALLILNTLIGGMREITGVVLGNVVAVQGEKGIVFFPREEIKRVWKI